LADAPAGFEGCASAARVEQAGGATLRIRGTSSLERQYAREEGHRLRWQGQGKGP